MKTKWFFALAAVALAAAVYGGTILATPPSRQSTTILARSLFNEIELNAHTTPANVWQARLKTQGLTDAYVVDNKFPAGASSGWHSHPGPSLVFVVAGTITNYTSDDPTCTGQVYPAGSGFVDEGGDHAHILRNEGTVTAETIAVQLLPTGSDRRIDAPAPSTCGF
jgi:hypothetical protein